MEAGGQFLARDAATRSPFITHPQSILVFSIPSATAHAGTLAYPIPSCTPYSILPIPYSSLSTLSSKH